MCEGILKYKEVQEKKWGNRKKKDVSNETREAKR